MIFCTRRGRSGRAGAGSRLGGRRASGQDQGERGTLALAALGAEAAVVGLDDVAADGQAQPGAAQPRGVGAGLGREEGLEDPPQVLRRNARLRDRSRSARPAGPAGSGASRKVTTPPSGMAWRALIRRLIRTCWIWAGFTRANGRPRSCTSSRTLFRARSLPARSTTSSTSRFRSTARAVIRGRVRAGTARAFRR